MRNRVSFALATVMVLMLASTGCGKKITLSQDNLTLFSGDTASLTATMETGNAIDIQLKWSSSDTEIATTADNGTITALSAGKAVIYVSADGYATRKCTLTVNPSVYVVGLDKSTGKGDFVAILWKNGVSQRLSHGYGVANSVFVSSNDVYAAGTDGRFDILWKNGVPQRLGGASNLKSVYVSGNDVYVAAQVRSNERTSDYNAGLIATLWKNDVPQYLSDKNSRATPNSIFVSGNDVYVAGQVAKQRGGYWDEHFATLWKNGNMQHLTDGTGFNQANSVYVSKGDVYVAGSQQYKYDSDIKSNAVLWKNGVPQRLSQASSVANSIFVSGKDVYVTGHEENAQRTRVAILWKNGVPQPLSQAFSDANSIFVLGSDVFVVGEEYSGNKRIEEELGDEVEHTNTVAMLWKNGIPQRLTDGKKHGDTASVFVMGNDVYVSGVEDDVATIWKNGVAERLGKAEHLGQRVFSGADCVYLWGKDVFVAGYEKPSLGDGVATLWINGIPQRLSDNFSEANSVFVK